MTLPQPLEENKIIRIKSNTNVNISNWIQTKESKKILSIQSQHLVDSVKRKKGRILEKGKRKNSTVEIRVGNWDQVFIQKTIEKKEKRVELYEALERNRESRELWFYIDGSYKSGKREIVNKLGYSIVQIDE